MKKEFTLDQKDLQILNHINKENKINLTEIGKELNLSHVTIRSRLNSLMTKKLVKFGVGVNLKKLN
ncbi:MAG: helix-turn-helix domain-containing protein [Candidatus Helarchaeota archaeon]